ncbi:MAG TPA: phosphoglucosamine mutase [Vicinamibacterales bacterium]|jgi:phosphomannomutase
MRAIPTLKISISGVRGVIGDSLTPDLLTRFAQAFGTYMGSGRVVVGRDTRTSGEMVRQAVVSGLLSSGCRIVDAGVCPTPTVQLLVRRLRAQGGIAITASHNPPEWNALKFIGPDALFLSGARGRELLGIYHQGEYTKARAMRLRAVEPMPGALDVHIEAVMDAVGPLPQTGRRLRVVLDSCNGAGSLVGPRLLEALGVDVIGINVTPDGRFPRPAEPTPENLEALCAAVREHRADIGFAQDMDADRLAIVSERGEPIGEERTLVLAVEHVLGRTPGPVVANLATTHALEPVAQRFGCSVFRTPVGEANVTEGMQRHRAVVGGEGNGGVIYPRINFARDSLVGMGLILHRLTDSGRTVSDLVASLPAFEIAKIQFPFPSQRLGEILRKARREFGDRPMDLRDGVKVMLPDAWFLLRGSNTEPVMRVVAESTSETAARELAETIRDKISGWL